MAEYLYFENKINELKRKLGAVLYSRNLEFTMVRLIFLKYAVDNYVGATTVDNMQLCARAQKMFAMRDIEKGIDTITLVLSYIDDAYGLNNILSGRYTIDEYARELFGDEIRQRKNAMADDYRAVMDALGSIDLEEESSDFSCGRALVKILVNSINLSSNKNSFAGFNTTRFSLSDLAGRILGVEETDVFCDFTSGIGLSTLEITSDTLPKVINIEKNPCVAAISAMLYIMYGYKKMQIICEDSLSNVVPDSKGNKIFVDPPLNAKITKTETNEFTDSSLAVIKRTVDDYLSDINGAKAVIAINASVLFSLKNQAIALRKELLDKGLLKAVVALPPMWRGSNVGTNLIVLSREKNNEVVFINAADNFITLKDRNDAKGESLLPKDTIISIVTAITENKDIEGFSKVVTYDDINDNECKFIPAAYVATIDESNDNITINEIDEKLAELYKLLLQ